jgi:hypothetical protein
MKNNIKLLRFIPKYIITFLFVFIVILQSAVTAQTQDTSTSKIYLGLGSGFAMKNIGYSQFLLRLDGNILYNWDNNFINLSYNKLFEFTIPFPGSNLGNANFQRVELNYGYSMIISKNHKLFKHISFSSSIGVSYNYIKYFKDEKAGYLNQIYIGRYPGIPIGIALTNNIGKDVYFGWEIKYQIISKFVPYGELNAFLMAGF